MNGADWPPTAPLAALRQRADVLARIRAFFAARGVLEVETPLLQHATVTDPQLASWRCSAAGSGGDVMYLQTSPESAMKRLLAAGSGPIYQLGKAFRGGETGRRHNPEFTLLEWYRPDFDHHQLMAEVCDLLREVLGERRFVHLTYRDWFERELGIDPFFVSTADLDRRLRATSSGQGAVGLDPDDRDGLLWFLVGHELEPRLAPAAITLVRDFPASQAALARTRTETGSDGRSFLVGERFEVYAGTLELANGYHELLDPEEQRRRFEHDLAQRRRARLPEPPVDERLLAALASGLPPCAGVALGVDRLVMAAAGAGSHDQVLAFPIDRA